MTLQDWIKENKRLIDAKYKRTVGRKCPSNSERELFTANDYELWSAWNQVNCKHKWEQVNMSAQDCLTMVVYRCSLCEKEKFIYHNV